MILEKKSAASRIPIRGNDDLFSHVIDLAEEELSCVSTKKNTLIDQWMENHGSRISKFHFLKSRKKASKVLFLKTCTISSWITLSSVLLVGRCRCLTSRLCDNYSEVTFVFSRSIFRRARVSKSLRKEVIESGEIMNIGY